jgi:hypothetical protein
MSNGKNAANEAHTFWYSELHAKWFTQCNQYYTEHPAYKNSVVIDGKEIIYTSCTVRPNATEPFEDALKRFPDYVKVADGKLGDIINLGKW